MLFPQGVESGVCGSDLCLRCEEEDVVWPSPKEGEEGGVFPLRGGIKWMPIL